MSDLNKFLEDGVPEPAPEPEALLEPIVEPIVEPAAEPIADPAALAEPGDELPDDVVKLRAALVATRRDHKGRADRAEGEAAALRAQLAELQRARTEPPPVAPPQQAPQQIPEAPNPQEDPQGYAEWFENVQFNRRANISEHAIRADKSITDLTPKIAAFKEAAATNPLLETQLKLAPDPWRWAYEQGGKIIASREEAAKRDAMLNEIGTDPSAYEAKLRAKWEAEMLAAPRAPEPVLPQSLAGARNAGGRPQAEEAVPEFEDIFKRKAR